MESKIIEVRVIRAETRGHRAERYMTYVGIIAGALAAALFAVLLIITIVAAVRGSTERPTPEAIQAESQTTVKMVQALPDAPDMLEHTVTQTGKAAAARVDEGQSQYGTESRYDHITDEERDLIAGIVWLEAGNQPFEGQQAVAEVILNRRAAENFPDTIAGVIHQEDPVQFTTAKNLAIAQPGEEQYEAVEAALTGEAVVDRDVVYFGRSPQNDNLFAKIGDHYFCRQYDWYYGSEG